MITLTLWMYNMKLINLNKYTDNNSDKFILDSLTKSSDEEMFNYASNVTSDLLNGVFLTEEFKSNAKAKLSKLNEKEIAELSIYMAITPYVQSNLVKTNINTWQNRATAFLETYISYIINTIDKDKFSKDLNEMKDILNLSDKFYEGLLSYFKESDEIISNCILEKLQF